MAESVLIPVAITVLDNLIPLANQQIGVAWGFTKDLRKLEERLTISRALLRDAERGRKTSEAMTVWLKNLKDATCEAENVLGEFAYEALRRQLERKNRMRYKVRNFFSLSNPMVFRLKMAHKVKNINSLFDQISEYARGIGLSPANQLMNAIVQPSEVRSTHPYVGNSKIVGRDGDVSAVRNMLLDPTTKDDDLSVIAIVGLAGLGKTTLAQLVYEDDKVVKNFGDQRMWICVSFDFKVERILNEMVQSLTRGKNDSTNIEGMVRNLREKLNGKRYLLVLDDVWNEIPDIWESMRNSLIGIGGSKGSKILVTTRSMKVVSTMRTSPSCTHNLDALSYDDGWTLFREIVFSSGGPAETQNLVDIGSRMVENCKGVPLAISSLGGLLYSEKDERKWLIIENSEVWRSPENKSGMLPALMLSFDHLPSPSLKQCFAYCSVFPKDFDIKKDELIQLWMSQGYLQPLSGRDLEMEDMGDKYFRIFLSRGLLQDVKFDEYKNITTCKMHDLVHDLALDVSEGNCLSLEASKVKDHPDVQHLSLDFGEETRLEISEENAKKLRTLLLNGNLPENIEDAKCIRAFSWIQRHEDTLPDSISKFIHSQYLDLSRTSIEKLPNFVAKLYNLQTLRLPWNLQVFPKEFHKLVRLRHLCVDDITNDLIIGFPRNIGQLVLLQTLPYFVVGKDKGYKMEELGCLSNLRGRLKIFNLQHVKDREQAEGAKMLNKEYIQELQFHWNENSGDSEVNHENVLEGLKPHPRALKCLIIQNYGGRSFVSWMRKGDAHSLENLVRIELNNCIRCEEIPPLGHLPLLEVIEMVGLNNLKCIGPEFYGHVFNNEHIVRGRSSSSSGAIVGAQAKVFPALRKFTLSNMSSLKEWLDIPSFPGDTKMFFPRLEILTIEDCPHLIMIPGHLFSFQELQIITHLSSTFTTFVEKKYSPCLNMEVSGDLNMDVFLEYLLEKNSKSLRKLEIKSLLSLTYFPNLKSLTSLEELHIHTCPNLISIIEEETEAVNIALLSLQKVSIMDCPQLACLPKALLVQTLVKLDIHNCDNLTMGDLDELHSLTSLQEVWISTCPKLHVAVTI